MLSSFFDMVAGYINTISDFVNAHQWLFIALGLVVASYFLYNLLKDFKSKEEVQKFSLLGFIFALIIGAYWGMRPIKDSIFGAMVGMSYQPYAKWLSLLIVAPLVIVYGKLIDKYPRHKVFYALTIIYAILGLVFAWAFFHPVMGLSNTVKDPSRFLGWCWYVYVESFGSLIVALFWAFTTDTTDPDVAKRGFPLIALCGQLGNIFGPFFLRAERWDFAHSAPIVLVVSLLIFGMTALMWLFMHVTPKSQLVGYQGQGAHDKEVEPGFLEGLKLLLTQPYLLGIFAIVVVFEVIVTIFDFYFKTAAQLSYPAEREMAGYLASYAVWTGIVASACVLFGINSIQRRLGMTASLVLMPILVAVAVVTLKMVPGLTVAFWIMVIAKAVNYALNQPTLKQVYIPTSRETKYKAQAWLEMFGSRGSKAGGSYINTYAKTFSAKYGPAIGISWFLTVSSMVSFSLIAVWLVAVVFVAKKYNKAIADNEVVC